MTFVLWVSALLLVLIGLIGALVPVLPGPVLVFAGLLLASWADDFARVGPATLAILALLTVAVYVVDFLAGAYGVEKTGASRRAVLGAVVGTVVGLFFGLAGLILGPFVGAVLGELTVKPRLLDAGRAGAGAWLGIVLGAAAKMALIFVMLGVFLTAYFL
jgi:uncharacterized protein YqgC (DUF456 family)